MTAIVRVQLLPTVLLSCQPGIFATIAHRTRGGTYRLAMWRSSRESACAGYCVADPSRPQTLSVSSQRHSHWHHHLGGQCLCSSYLHTRCNRFSQKFEQEIAVVWNLAIKPDSKQFLQILGEEMENEPYCDEWAGCGEMLILGHILKGNGSFTSCFNAAIAAAWRAFWGNLGCKEMRNQSEVNKIMTMCRAILPHIRWRCSRWPFCASFAARLDAIQRRMLRMCCPFRPLPYEELNVFFRRKSRYINSLILNFCCPWSAVWAARVVDWNAHLRRHTDDPFYLPSVLIKWHGRDWLIQQRSQFVQSAAHAWSVLAGRTGTRRRAVVPVKGGMMGMRRRCNN